MLERDLIDKARISIKRHFPDAWIWKINDRTTSGIPDLLIINDGRHIFFEMKRPNAGKISKIQKVQVDRINNAGGEAYFCDSVEKVIKLLTLKGGEAL